MNALTRGFLVGRAILTAICKGQVLLILLVAFGLSTLGAKSAWGQAVEWKPLQLPRQSAQGMVFDSRRGVTVLFGGSRSAGVTSGETWEWIDDKWMLRSLSGPSPRAWHAMAYDSARGVTVLFGGSPDGCDCSRNGETWEWDGTAWTQRMVIGPSARMGHQMAYDSARGVVVLFGGITSDAVFPCSGDTWEWNGSVWTQRSTTGPSPRYRHAMAYDALRGVTVLTGGADRPFPEISNSQTWEWNGSAWTQRLLNGSFGAGHAMCYDSDRHVVVAFSFSKTLEWDGATWTQRPISGPSSRSGHSLAYDSARGQTILFGGGGNSETWKLEGNVWVQLTFSEPTRRFAPAMSFDASRNVGVLFGGTSDGITGNGETWVWNGASWDRRDVSGPPARFYHAMAYDSARQVSVLFGGFTRNNVVIGETWEWNGSLWSQRAISGPFPSARGSPAMVYDARRGVTVLFGGYLSNGTHLNETWEWDGTTWTQRLVAGPSPRAWSAMTYDTSRGVCVLFGGWEGHHNLGDTWEWDGTAWIQQVPSGDAPSSRSNHAMAFDSARGVSVLFGGGYGSDSLSNETWDWDGAHWTRRVIDGASGRMDHAMVFDSARGSCLLFGGFIRTLFGVPASSETWGLLAVCAADFNRDGAVDFFDYDDFVRAFEAGDAGADTDADGTVDFFDYDAFVVAFEVGC